MKMKEIKLQVSRMSDEYLGRVCCVKCKLESKNNKGELSMNFPIWQCLREEGKEVSYES